MKTQSKIEFKDFDLPNGLHVILHKDDTNPIITVDIWYHVGAKDEDTNRTGFAHLFEHMMFQGSKNVGKTEHFTYIQKAGGTLNGTTNQDRTNYFETVPSNQLELVLWLESDRMSTLKITQENFDNQREVVKEEKRQRYDNVPYGDRWENLYKKAFKGQTYQWLPIGSMKDLNDANLAYAQQFYNKYYSPDNAVLVVSGDIDYENAEKLVKKYFGPLEPAGTKRKEYAPISFSQGEIIDSVIDNVQLPALFIGYKIPGVKSHDLFALELLSMILSDGKSSRLYKKIVYEDKLAKSVNTFLWENELGGLFIVAATGLKNTDLKRLEAEVTAVIEEVRNSQVTDLELEKSKNSAESHVVNNLQTTMGKADQLAYYWTYFKDTELINKHFDIYSKITAGEIYDNAVKYLAKDNRVVLFYPPGKKDDKSK